MVYSCRHTSDVRYKSRPPANRRAARWAWDRFEKDGPIEVLWLGQGYWIVLRPGGEGDEVDAVIARYHSHPDRKRSTERPAAG